MQTQFTTGELAAFLGAREWRVRRLFEDGTLEEPPRFGGKRAIPRSMIPDVCDALRDRGWLPPPQKNGRAAGAADDSSPRQGDQRHGSG